MQTQLLSRPTLFSHLRALYAVGHRSWKQYWRYPLNALSFVFEPISWIAPIYFMGLAFSVNGKAIGFAQYSGTTDFISFTLLGAAVANFISSVFWGMGYSLKNDMDAGVMESNWLTPIPRLLFLIGTSLNGLAVTTITTAGMLLCGGLIFGLHVSGSLWLALRPIVPMIIGLYGFGFAFAALVMLLREANTLVDVGSSLVQLFSGTSFPVNALPKFLLPVALALPFTYGLDAARSYLIGTTTILPIRWEMFLLVISMFAMLWIGVASFRSLERRVRRLGTLGQH